MTSVSPGSATSDTKPATLIEHTPSPACQMVVKSVEESMHRFEAMHGRVYDKVNPFTRFRNLERSLHVGATLERKDGHIWDHIFPTYWDTLWSSKDKKLDIKNVVRDMLQLCEQMATLTKKHNSTQLMDWFRLKNLLRECEVDVSGTVSRTMYQWVDGRMENCHSIEEQLMETHEVKDGTDWQPTGLNNRAQSAILSVNAVRNITRTTMRKTVLLGVWATVLHALLTYGIWITSLAKQNVRVPNYRSSRNPIKSIPRMLRETMYGFCHHFSHRALALATVLYRHQGLFQALLRITCIGTSCIILLCADREVIHLPSAAMTIFLGVIIRRDDIISSILICGSTVMLAFESCKWTILQKERPLYSGRFFSCCEFVHHICLLYYLPRSFDVVRVMLFPSGLDRSLYTLSGESTGGVYLVFIQLQLHALLSTVSLYPVFDICCSIIAARGDWRKGIASTRTFRWRPLAGVAFLIVEFAATLSRADRRLKILDELPEEFVIPDEIDMVKINQDRRSLNLVYQGYLDRLIVDTGLLVLDSILMVVTMVGFIGTMAIAFTSSSLGGSLTLLYWAWVRANFAAISMACSLSYAARVVISEAMEVLHLGIVNCAAIILRRASAATHQFFALGGMQFASLARLRDKQPRQQEGRRLQQNRKKTERAARPMCATEQGASLLRGKPPGKLYVAEPNVASDSPGSVRQSEAAEAPTTRLQAKLLSAAMDSNRDFSTKPVTGGRMAHPTAQIQHFEARASSSSPVQATQFSNQRLFTGLLEAEASLLEAALAQNDEPVPSDAEGRPPLPASVALVQPAAVCTPRQIPSHRRESIAVRPEEPQQVDTCSAPLPTTAAFRVQGGDMVEALCCPITQEMMADPVLAADGFSYERSAIATWLARGNSSSPMTGAPLAHHNLMPNLALRSAVEIMKQLVEHNN